MKIKTTTTTGAGKASPVADKKNGLTAETFIAAVKGFEAMKAERTETIRIDDATEGVAIAYTMIRFMERVINELEDIVPDAGDSLQFGVSMLSGYAERELMKAKTYLDALPSSVYVLDIKADRNK